VLDDIYKTCFYKDNFKTGGELKEFFGVLK
jgi:hypothetical protein